MNVLLISANTTVAPYPVYPVGLDYVAGAITPRHNVQILDMNVCTGRNPLQAAIGEFAPDVVGVSIRNIDNVDTKVTKSFIGGYRDLAEQVRHCTSVPLVLGGSGFSIFPDQLMKLLDADFGVVGEGESMILLLDSLEKGADPSGLPGIVSRSSAIPFPSAPWTGETLRRMSPSTAQLDFYLRRGGMLNLQTKRGCPYRCIYCTYPHIEGHRLRLMDPDQVAADARRLQDMGARYLFITDSVFNADLDHSSAVANAFRRHGVSIPWGAFFAPSPPSDGYYQRLAEAGLRHVEFGTESLSHRMLKTYRKPFTIQDVFKAHKMAGSASLHIAHYLLLGGPGEDAHTLDETMKNAEEIEKAVFFIFCGIRIFPHTPLYEIADREGQIPQDADLLLPLFYRSTAINTEEITVRVHLQARGRSNWVYGDGGQEAERVLARLHAHGHIGPLWEYLMR